jgi:integrase
MYVGKVRGKEAKRRNKLWYARDRADGVKRSFDTEAKAKEFSEDYNSNKRRRAHNIPPTNKELEDWSVRQLLNSYMAGEDHKIAEDEFNDEELIESCELQDNFGHVLLNFSVHRYADDKSLYEFTSDVAKKYVKDMLGETYTSEGSETEKTYSPDTIRRNITAIQRAWKWGRETIPTLSNLENPWKGVSVPGAGYKRQRGLRKGEREKLLQHCKECRGSNRYYIPLAISFAEDTAMRRGEIFNLTWNDVDFTSRTINIEKDKNSWRRPGGVGRLICLPPYSTMALKLLYVSLMQDGKTPGAERFDVPKEMLPPHGHILMNTEKKAMTGNGFKQAFEEVRDRAGIVDINPRKRLTPHSLRAAAESAFRKIGLSEKEIDVQKNGIKSHYDVLDDFLEAIHEKLDTAVFTTPLNEVGVEQRDLITVQYPLQHGLSLEDVAKLGYWLFNDVSQASEPIHLTEAAE